MYLNIYQVLIIIFLYLLYDGIRFTILYKNIEKNKNNGDKK